MSVDAREPVSSRSVTALRRSPEEAVRTHEEGRCPLLWNSGRLQRNPQATPAGPRASNRRRYSLVYPACS